MNFDKWAQYDVDAALREVGEDWDDSSDPDDNDLDALRCTRHGVLFKPNKQCRQCRKLSPQAMAHAGKRSHVQTVAGGIPRSSEEVESSSVHEKVEASSEVMDQVEQLKQCGNKFAKDSQWQKAQGEYQSGLEALDRVCGGSDNIGRTTAKLATALHLNFALACLKRRQWLEAENHCTSALHLDGNCQKAFYRRALAKEGSSSSLKKPVIGLQAARDDMRKAFDLSTRSKVQDRSIEAELKRLRARVDEHENASRESCALEALGKDIEDTPDHQVDMAGMLAKISRVAKALPDSSLAKVWNSQNSN